MHFFIEKMPVYEGKLTNKEIFLWKKQKILKVCKGDYYGILCGAGKKDTCHCPC